jgi:hypothetical protein
MKKLQFLLLDAGPIIKLFELGIWDKFVEKCEAIISQTVANQAERVGNELGIELDIEPYRTQGLVKIFDLDPKISKAFCDKFDLQYRAEIHPGEKETLAFLYNSKEPHKVCSADKAVFRVLGLLGRGEQGISLEEITNKVGLQIGIKWAKVSPKNFDWWKFTKKFREVYTQKGQIDAVQGHGCV